MKHHDGRKGINKVDGGKARAKKQYHKKLRTASDDLIKVDLGHNASRHYKETLFETGVEEPMLGYRHLVVYRESPNAVGSVRVSGRSVTPSQVKDLTDAEVQDKFDLSERELYECRYYNQQRIDRRKMGLE